VKGKGGSASDAKPVLLGATVLKRGCRGEDVRLL
jgi:hypothetical protein